MRAIHAFMLTTLALASVMTASHYAVVWLLRKPSAPVTALLAPPDAVPLVAAPPPVEVAKFCPAAGAQWLADARATAARICAENGEVTADDVWNACRPPENVDGRLLGPVFAGKEWEKIGETRSERGNNNNRYIAVWRRREDVAA